MRKYILLCFAIIVLALIIEFVYYHTSFYIDVNPNAKVSIFTKTKGKEILLDTEAGYQNFEIKGVDMGAGIPGHYATDYEITKSDYLRWFQYIQAMGANTIRVYTILSPAFYEAVYEYNQNQDSPLYILQGLWLDDYIQNSHRDAYDPDFIDAILADAHIMIDVVHGKRKIAFNPDHGYGTYKKDISPWVIGYILGVEWEDITVAYTDHMQKEKNHYEGQYMVTTPEATPFESMLARLGDVTIAYESKRYKTQRLVAFANWPTTDPFDYDDNVKKIFRKIAKVDVEHIKTTKAFLSGQFASYHVYPYYPAYLRYGSGDLTYLMDETGNINTYRAYLKMLTAYHTMPVVISEFGVPSSRGMAQIDYDRGFNQGQMSEQDQGEALVQCYRDIQAAGCAGSVIFTWQDEWSKRTWNTMHAVDLTQTPYWSDYQTNEQYFGLLAFDPGEKESLCYVDGNDSDWTEQDMVWAQGELSLSLQHDEKFLYFLVRKPDYQKGDILYIPLDITPKTGATNCQNYNLSFDRPVDFLLVIQGKDEARVLVQERYEVLRAMYYRETHGVDPYEFPPAKDTPIFKEIHLLLQLYNKYNSNEDYTRGIMTYETGKLIYGNANPTSESFDSLADYCAGKGFVEIKLPWQLLNFSNPSDMQIHDDYYEHYGVENLSIKELYAGLAYGIAGQKIETISLHPFPLKRWKNQVTYHERLKASYYKMQAIWTKGEKG